jgi:hypothetical protein
MERYSYKPELAEYKNGTRVGPQQFEPFTFKVIKPFLSGTGASVSQVEEFVVQKCCKEVQYKGL